MKLIVGLGNPGIKYSQTRHNTGFIIIDNFALYYSLKFKEGKGDWLYCGSNIGGTDYYLMKPVTFMNNSGYAVLDFVNRYGIQTEDMLVVYDDFQIPAGTIRVRPAGSDGGHSANLLPFGSN